MRLELHNIGPIRDACVDFGPLTILIGPNGSGKTILSTVAYAASTAVIQATRLSGPLVRRWAMTRDAGVEVTDIVSRWEERFRDVLERELQRCLAEDLSTLGREFRAGRMAAPRITVGQSNFGTDDGWTIVCRVDSNRLVLERSNPHYRSPSLELPDKSGEEFGEWRAFDRHLQRVFASGIPARSYYFPASRSGFMQTFNTLTALVFGALGSGYFEDATLGKIPGTAADFLRFLAQLRPTRTTKTGESALELFEDDLLHGRISLEETGPSRLVTFAPSGFNQRYPIESVATSAAEVAPLLLYLKHVAAPSDAIFIDEPEAHFHPASQVGLARALMAVADEVENVVLATHSEFLISELSNVVMERAGQAKDVSRRFVSPLRIYEFVHSTPRKGVLVQQHTFDPLEGFDIAQFSAVAEQTYDRSIDIYNRVHGGELEAAEAES